ncbi:MAG: arsenite methyltransferase [Bacteroidales bacterium]|nr:arsenite methyltransferase [Bacteroidales bacterium]
MKNPEELKAIVKDKYSDIVIAKSTCCCSGAEPEYTIFSEDYAKQKGYCKDADLSLGCGIPTEHAGIKPGDAVLDLGSGAGNDCFVARALVGEAGKVTGLDFTDKMIEKACENNQKLVYSNVKFVKGDIENMPLPNNSFDVIISNCVLNLDPDKEKAFNEIFRVLKTGGHFCVSDIVLNGKLPEKVRDVAAMYAGCVSGAEQKEYYLEIIKKAGFSDINIKREIYTPLPDAIFLEYISKEEISDYRNSGAGIYSITVTGIKI